MTRTKLFDSSQFNAGEFTVEDIKSELADLLRDNLYPEQTIGTSEVTLSTTINYEVAQCFIPYSTCYEGRDKKHTLTTYLKFKKYDTPDDGITIYLQDDSNSSPNNTLASYSIPVGSIDTIATTVSFDLILDNKYFISKSKYWLTIVPNNTPSTVNYFSIYSRTIDTDYLLGSYYKRESGGTWSAQSLDLFFQIEVPNWIYKIYPANTLDIMDFPRISIDIVDRPVVDERYIDHRIYKQRVSVATLIYSRYPDELDSLTSYVDKIIRRHRINFSTADIVIPSRITPPSVIRDNIFVRSLFYLFDQRIQFTDDE